MISFSFFLYNQIYIIKERLVNYCCAYVHVDQKKSKFIFVLRFLSIILCIITVLNDLQDVYIKIMLNHRLSLCK